MQFSIILIKKNNYNSNKRNNKKKRDKYRKKMIKNEYKIMKQTHKQNPFIKCKRKTKKQLFLFSTYGKNKIRIMSKIIWNSLIF